MVPDNLKSGVSKPASTNRFKSDLPGMAEHYGCAVLPARPRKPEIRQLWKMEFNIPKMDTGGIATFYFLQSGDLTMRSGVSGAYQYPFAAPGKERPQGSV